MLTNHNVFDMIMGRGFFSPLNSLHRVISSMDKIYLSIDLDYWICTNGNWRPPKGIPFLRKVFNLGVPLQVVLSHEELLKYINKSGANAIINIDYHSDLADNDVDGVELNEGTWGNHVAFCGDQNASFIWIHPYPVCNSRNEGRCDEYENPFTKQCKRICGWTKTERKCGKLPSKSVLNKVVEVGISISPNWCEEDELQEYLDFLLGKEVSVKKTLKRLQGEILCRN